MLLVSILLIAGLVLIVAEIFLPGMVVGIIGGICLIVSVVLCFREQGGLFGTFYMAGVMILSVIVVGLGMKYFPRTALGQKMVLSAHSGGGNEQAWLAKLKGKQGTAHTMLRPAGTAIIDEKRIDVVTEGGIIPKGSNVEVIDVEGTRVVVRKV